MKRRGPDSQDFFKKLINKEFALLHSRLNIIDLSSNLINPFMIKI